MIFFERLPSLVFQNLKFTPNNNRSVEYELVKYHKLVPGVF